MLLLDNNLLGDYLTSTPAAKRFLEAHEQEVWAVSSIVVFEALVGCLHGHIEATPEEVRQGIVSSMDVFPVTEQTAYEGYRLQQELQDRGSPVGQLDALIAGSAREHGATFATAEKQFWDEGVRDVLSVAEYDPN